MFRVLYWGYIGVRLGLYRGCKVILYCPRFVAGIAVKV